MTTILSMDRDHSTDEVIDWMAYFGQQFERINISRDIEKVPINFSLTEICQDNSGEERNKAWLRKIGLFRDLDAYKNLLTRESFDIANYVYSELNAFRKFYYVKDRFWTGDPKSFHISKIEVLIQAKNTGIDIPETYVINTKQKLEEICKKHKEIITKSLTDIPRFTKLDKLYSPLTTAITLEDIETLPEMFFPTLVQNLIDKEFEVRSFYLNGNLYSSAIFSQTDPQTALDFRKYNYKKQNRLVPYTLPIEIENKLKVLCEKCNINTGSIDIIKGLDGKFYFLEINQGGQFGMVSRPCNYKLEKLMAKNLAENEITGTIH